MAHQTMEGRGSTKKKDGRHGEDDGECQSRERREKDINGGDGSQGRSASSALGPTNLMDTTRRGELKKWQWRINTYLRPICQDQNSFIFFHGITNSFKKYSPLDFNASSAKNGLQ